MCIFFLFFLNLDKRFCFENFIEPKPCERESEPHLHSYSTIYVAILSLIDASEKKTSMCFFSMFSPPEFKFSRFLLLLSRSDGGRQSSFIHLSSMDDLFFYRYSVASRLIVDASTYATYRLFQSKTGSMQFFFS